MENPESGIHPETVLIQLAPKSVWIVVETQGLEDYSSLNVLRPGFKRTFTTIKGKRLRLLRPVSMQ